MPTSGDQIKKTGHGLDPILHLPTMGSRYYLNLLLHNVLHRVTFREVIESGIPIEKTMMGIFLKNRSRGAGQRILSTMLHHLSVSTDPYGTRTGATVNNIVIWVAEGVGPVCFSCRTKSKNPWRHYPCQISQGWQHWGGEGETQGFFLEGIIFREEG